MLQTRHEILAGFKASAIVPHPQYPGFETFSGLSTWMPQGVVVELPRVKIAIGRLDYLRNFSMPAGTPDTMLRFQQDCYRLWYQVDGTGILQNATRNTFGNARPGLLGVMDIGERHAYLHQKGPFECFLMEFSLLPSHQAKCYWNSEVEGRAVLDGNDRLYFENLVFDCIRVIAHNREMLGLASMSRILEILVVLLGKGILVIEESQFPRNRQKSLVAKAIGYLRLNYGSLRRQGALARECGVDINYLNLIFFRETGKTLYRYLVDIRMEHAKHLLETNAVPVAEIASVVGYPNPNSFTRAFKRHESLTPTEYQRRRQQQPSPSAAP